MTAPWTIGSLIEAVARRESQPAVIFAAEQGMECRDGATLAAQARRMAAGLQALGVARGTPVAIHGGNSIAWIAVALGIMASGAVLQPFDDMLDTAQVLPALADSGAHILFTTRRHLRANAAALRAAGIRPVLLEAPEHGLDDAAFWEDLLGPPDSALRAVTPEQPAALFATSGTTGRPKTFHLTHRNIGSTVLGVRDFAYAGPGTRALLPLPLHHAYPFVIGVLVVLDEGGTVVLSGGFTGPAIMRAARDAEATAVIGVPRLYDAIARTLEQRLAGLAWPLRWAFRGLLAVCTAARRSLGMRPGRLLFAGVRRSVAPSLRLLISGGARLDPATAERLEDLGWEVVSGYGLAETAAGLVGNRPGERSVLSVGKPFGDGRVRIAAPDQEGIGEIELQGSSITSGYLDNPEANRTAFTADGWFRTGDLGRLDRDGSLLVTGRVKEVLVLGGGKKVNPEDLERIYGTSPDIEEIAVLERDGAIVALVRPNLARLLEHGVLNPRDGIGVALTERAQGLPTYQRLAGFALVDEPLPRTRLGKYRRFMLGEIYARALSGRATREAREPSAEDAALLAEPAAAAAWALLQSRHPGQRLDLDMSPALDLNYDSFAWMELAVALEERCRIRLGEGDIAGIGSLRDLLRLSVERSARAAAPAGEAPAVATDLGRWLAPTGLALRATAALLFVVNRWLMRLLFRLRAEGGGRLPPAGAFVITPNHVSDLDPMVVAAALPLSRLRRLHWAGDAVRLFSNGASRLFCRVVHLFPVDEKHPAAAVSAAAQVLGMGHALVWFPEGWRSPDGRPMRFQPGIGQLLLRSRVPAVPAFIVGTFEALPRTRRVPRLVPVRLIFGEPVDASTLLAEVAEGEPEERIAAALRARVLRLGREAGTIRDDAPPLALPGQ